MTLQEALIEIEKVAQKAEELGMPEAAKLIREEFKNKAQFEL